MKHTSYPIKILAVILLLIQLATITAFAREDYRKETTYSPLSGVTVTKVSAIENGGFFNYQVVTCDLANSGISLDLLYPDEGGSTLQSTRETGKENGAAVIINADYFNRSDEATKGSAVGFNQKDGQLLSNALEELEVLG